jgi:acyl-CoA synthetase (AMP-forming)/AMP-acid ligase II
MSGIIDTLKGAADLVIGYSTVAINLLPGGRYQLLTQKVKGGGRDQGAPVVTYKNLPASIRDVYRPFFEASTDKTWVIYAEERLTYGRAWEITEAIGRDLVHGMGLNKGDCVGIAMRNFPEYVLAFVAIQCAGLICVPLNSLWKTEELEYSVKDAGVKLIFGDSERLRRCEPFRKTLGIRTVLCRPEEIDGEEPVPEANTTWAAMLEAGTKQPRIQFTDADPEDVAMILYTSGSTGFPKGVEHTQRSQGTAMRLMEMGGVIMPAGNCVLLPVPLFHITGIAGIFLRSLASGASIVMMRKWDAGVALKLIEQEGVSAFMGVPTMVRDMLEHPTFTPEAVKTLKSMAAGGAPVPPSQVEAMKKKMKTTKSGQAYGLTETIAATVINGAEYEQRPTSCGKPVPLLVEVCIKDPVTGRVMPTEERGEICIRSAMVMKGYHNQPEKTAEVIDHDGWFHSGDIGRKDSSGYVYIMDRMKDLIIRGGENIDCSEVEAALYAHPAVREVSVFALPDERLGEVVGAAVWCTDEEVSSSDLAATAASTLAKFKVPLPEDVFIMAEELPKGATGKIDKKGLRARFGEIVAQRNPKSRL